MSRESGSIGIGAMIVFIALILVAAIASTVIISSVEDLSIKSEQSNDDRQFSKVEISDILLFNYEPCWVDSHPDAETCPGGNPRDRGHYELALYFSVSGDVELQTSEIHYSVSCRETLTTLNSPYRTVTFGTPSTFDSQSSLDGGYTNAPFNRQAVVLPGEEFDNFANSIDTLELGVTYAVMIDLFDNQNTAAMEDDEGCRITTDFTIELTIMVEGGYDTFAIIDCENFRLGMSCY
tara:strand:- start:124 stop:831 length:708 start_codon:yes stop_codon:yes gene_type:complete